MNDNQTLILELPNSNYRLLICKVNYLLFLLSQDIYSNCGVIASQESLLNDLKDDGLVSIQDFNIYYWDRSGNEKCVEVGVVTSVNVINLCQHVLSLQTTVDYSTLRCEPKHLNKCLP